MQSSEKIRICTLGIDGMTCSSCSGTVENSLNSVEGVISAQVNLSTNTAEVRYRDDIVKINTLVDEVEVVGFGAEVLNDSAEQGAESTAKSPLHSVNAIVLGIDGMTCSSCSGTVENSIKSLNGVLIDTVIVSLSTNTANFEYDSSQLSGKEIVDEIESIGFGAEILENKPLSATINDGNGKEASKDDVGAIKTLLLLIEVTTTQDPPHPARPLQNGYAHQALSTSDSNSISSTHLTDANLYDILQEIQQLTGVSTAELNTADAQIKVTYDDFLTGPRDFHSIITSAGFHCSITTMGGFMMANRLLKTQTKEINKLYSQLMLASGLTVPIFCITMILPIFPYIKRGLETEIFPGLAVNGLLLFLLSFPVQFYVGHQFHSKAWKTLKTRSLGMDFLVSTGTLAAYLYSSAGLVMGMISGVPNLRDVEYFETAAVLITAVLLGKFLELYAKGQTAAAIHKLSKLKANTARLVQSGTDSSTSTTTAVEGGAGEEHDAEIDAALLHRRDIVRLIPGETVPADGKLLTGAHIGVDEAMMTGESAIVAKAAGDTVYGGTIVIEGSALMLVTACGDDSTLGRIISTVQQAQASKPPIQELADNVAKRFVPAIALVSLVTFVTWMVAYAAGGVPKEWYASAGNPFLFAFFFALAVWVSACPCAFGLATPTAVLVATGVAAKHGILIRKGAALQYASNVNVVAFDKTGTLTRGCTEISDFLYCRRGGSVFAPLGKHVAPSNPFPTPVAAVDKVGASAEERYLLQLMLLAECRSSHPLAKGITAFCKTHLAALDSTASTETMGALPAEDSLLFDVVPGLGIHMYTHPAQSSATTTASVSVLVGSGKLLQAQNVHIPTEIADTASSYRAGGKVAVYLAVDGQLRAIMGVSDAVRPEAAHVVRALHRQGIACYMITGDETTTAQAIARVVGIPPQRILARAKPDDKKGFIEALQRSHQLAGRGRQRELKVAFVGDGTNDSPALAVADVGFTMASGSDIAVESGDMVLCKSDLHALLVALDLSKQTMTRIHLNYFWALGYNALLIPVAAGVLFPRFHFALAPMLAGMAMALSSVSIVVSSLLLVRYQPPHAAQHIGKSAVGKGPALVAGGAEVEVCGCPASSVLDLAIEEPDLWARLSGWLAGSQHSNSLTSTEKLLTPAQWRKGKSVGGAAADGDSDEEGELGDAGAYSTGSSSADTTLLSRVLNPMGWGHAAAGSREGGRGSRNVQYTALDTGAEVWESESGAGDIELGRAGGSKLFGKVTARKGATAAGGGCGCGKSNCRCGASCRCDEVAVKVHRV